jgi:DNA-binding PadR family transcriptional regulator
MQKRADKPARIDPRRHLPLRPAAFAVLAALADGPHPGIEILDAINATAGGWTVLGPGSLYRLLRELRDIGWIARTSRGSRDDDERKAYHALTSEGRPVLRAEAARLRRTLQLADAGHTGS